MNSQLGSATYANHTRTLCPSGSLTSVQETDASQTLPWPEGYKFYLYIRQSRVAGCLLVRSVQDTPMLLLTLTPSLVAEMPAAARRTVEHKTSACDAATIAGSGTVVASVASNSISPHHIGCHDSNGHCIVVPMDVTEETTHVCANAPSMQPAAAVDNDLVHSESVPMESENCAAECGASVATATMIASLASAASLPFPSPSDASSAVERAVLSSPAAVSPRPRDDPPAHTVIATDLRALVGVERIWVHPKVSCCCGLVLCLLSAFFAKCLDCAQCRGHGIACQLLDAAKYPLSGRAVVG